MKLLTSVGSQKKQENSKKKNYLCFIDYAEAFDCVDHNKLWKILKEMGTKKDRNKMDLKEAEVIKRSWQEYMKELYKKYLND